MKFSIFKNIRNSPLCKMILIGLFLILLLFTRFYNLERTARFIWDESSDLTNIHQIFVERKLTIIGPISEDGEKVFGSLTYYMLLPFAIIGKFDPLSTATGAAFWGSVTAVLFLFLVRRVNSKLVIPLGILILVWFPLISTSRWAWNPNLIPFWVAGGLLLLLKDNSWSMLFSGICFGFTIHHHYVSIFSITVFTLLFFLKKINEKKLLHWVMFVLGLSVAIIPFILFDLLHPPGLFLTRVLYFNHLDATWNLKLIIDAVIRNYWMFIEFTTQNYLVSLLIAGFTLLLLLCDLKKKNEGLIFGLTWFVSLFCLIAISPFYEHYLITIVGFYFIWIMWPRKSFSKYLAVTIVYLLIITSLLSVKSVINDYNWQADIKSTRYIASKIHDEIEFSNLKNVNIAVVGSSDPNIYGRRYRDLLLIKQDTIKSKEEYSISDLLFVVTTSKEDQIRLDPAVELNNFRNGNLINTWLVPDSTWQILLFTRNNTH